MLNIDIPPVAMPSAVIVTTDSLAAATTFGRSASVMILAGTAFGWVEAAGLPIAAAGAGARVAPRRPTVPAEARTAARTLAPTTARTPREEERRAGIVGTGDTMGFGVGNAAAAGACAELEAAAGWAGGTDGAAWGAGTNVGSGEIFDHSVMWRLLAVSCAVL